MALGMTPAEFWEAPVDLCSAYREAHRLREEMDNARQWRMGAYVYDTMLRVFPAYNAFAKGEVRDYMDSPFGTEREDATFKKVDQDERKMQAGMDYMEAFAAMFNSHKGKDLPKETNEA